MAKDNIKRFPRPMGTTAMAAEYQKSQNLEDLQKVYYVGLCMILIPSQQRQV